MYQVNQKEKKPYGKIILGVIVVIVAFKIIGGIVKHYERNSGIDEFELQERAKANQSSLEYTADRIMSGK